MSSKFLSGGSSGDLSSLQNGSFALNVASIVNQDLAVDGVLRSTNRKIGVGLVDETDLSFSVLSNPLAATLIAEDVETTAVGGVRSLNGELSNINGELKSQDGRISLLEMSQPDQGLNTTDTPTFAGLTVNGVAQASDFKSDSVPSYNSAIAALEDKTKYLQSDLFGQPAVIVDPLVPLIVGGPGDGITITNDGEKAISAEDLIVRGRGTLSLRENRTVDPSEIIIAEDSITLDATAIVVDGLPTTTNADVSAGTTLLTKDQVDARIAAAPVTTLASAGGTESLVVSGTGPALSTKGLTAGAGITLTPGANDITIAAPGSNPFDQSLNTTDSPSFVSVEIDGTDPADGSLVLTNEPFVLGTRRSTFASTAPGGLGEGLVYHQYITTASGSNVPNRIGFRVDKGANPSGSLIEWYVDGGPPQLELRAGELDLNSNRIVDVGTPVAGSDAATLDTVSNAVASIPSTTIASAGGTESLVVSATGPALSTKGLTAGAGITLTASANDITLAAANGGNPFDQDLNTTNNVEFADIRTTTDEVHIGADAGIDSQGANAVAVGVNAGQFSQGLCAVALGDSAGAGTLGVPSDSQGQYATAIGCEAGKQEQGSFATAVGSGAGNNAQGSTSVALGRLAGESALGAKAVAIGHLAGRSSSTEGSVYLGSNAGVDGGAHNNTVTIVGRSGVSPYNPSAANQTRIRSGTTELVHDATGLSTNITLDSTNASNGSINTPGGIGCAKSLFVGGDITASGQLVAPNLLGVAIGYGGNIGGANAQNYLGYNQIPNGGTSGTLDQRGLVTLPCSGTLVISYQTQKGEGISFSIIRYDGATTTILGTALLPGFSGLVDTGLAVAAGEQIGFRHLPPAPSAPGNIGLVAYIRPLGSAPAAAALTNNAAGRPQALNAFSIEDRIASLEATVAALVGS